MIRSHHTVTTNGLRECSANACRRTHTASFAPAPPSPPAPCCAPSHCRADARIPVWPHAHTQSPHPHRPSLPPLPSSTDRSTTIRPSTPLRSCPLEHARPAARTMSLRSGSSWRASRSRLHSPRLKASAPSKGRESTSCSPFRTGATMTLRQSRGTKCVRGGSVRRASESGVHAPLTLCRAAAVRDLPYVR